jgi:hypothetical protein
MNKYIDLHSGYMIYYNIANFDIIVKYKYPTKINITDEIAYIYAT